ncbi:MAG: Stp1/IreP family PP2C-type Ser/Thr phosphatase [Actinobacteria bacterium]|nr:MAG: Stp1/IreP family PP2C-type Ser/Thr phosphatase [Actinomycetota bacterium]
MALRIAEKASLTNVGRQRQSNEDSYLERDPLFAVADGMGGARAGEVASRMAVEAFDSAAKDASPEETLRSVAQEANRRIYEMAQGDTEHAGMGTTLTAAMVTGREVAVGHVGDSRLYRLRDGKLERLTEDHSLVEELMRQGRLTPEEAESHPQRSIITRALGPEPEVDVETFTDSARDGDVYLICSDGLSGMVSEEDMTAILEGSRSLDGAASQLVDAANEAGGKDNITVVLFRLESDGEPEPEPPPDTLSGKEAEEGLSSETVRDAVAEAKADAGTMAIGADEAASAREHAAPEARPATERRAPRQSPVRVLPPDEARRRPAGRRRSRRRIGAAIAVLAVAAAVFGLYEGGRQFYFIGTDARGVVALYRGLPYDLPLGIHLYTRVYSSDVPASAITNHRQRANLLDHQLRSRGDAVTRLRELERSETPR